MFNEILEISSKSRKMEVVICIIYSIFIRNWIFNSHEIDWTILLYLLFWRLSDYNNYILYYTLYRYFLSLSNILYELFTNVSQVGISCFQIQMRMKFYKKRKKLHIDYKKEWKKSIHNVFIMKDYSSISNNLVMKFSYRQWINYNWKVIC